MKEMHYAKSKFTVYKTFVIQTNTRGFHIKTDLYTLYKSGLLKVKKGYSWDGASGAIDTEDIILASCIHDIFCEMINDGLLPDYVQAIADEDFRLIEKKQGMHWFRRGYTYMAVRLYMIVKKYKPKKKIYKIYYQ